MTLRDAIRAAVDHGAECGDTAYVVREAGGGHHWSWDAGPRVLAPGSAGSIVWQHDFRSFPAAGDPAELVELIAAEVEREDAFAAVLAGGHGTRGDS